MRAICRLEIVQHMAGHTARNPRTLDRRNDEVRLDEVERIGILQLIYHGRSLFIII